MRNGKIWTDNNGIHINAHGGGILTYNDHYYWFGEHKTEGWEGRLAYDGVHCYSSPDLQCWKDEGIVFAVSNNPSSPICRGCRIERPKVIFNKSTKKFVLWFHSTDENHTIAKSGVAVADNPLGPYKFLYSFYPNAGNWPLNVTDIERDANTANIADKHGKSFFCNGENPVVCKHNILGRDFANGQMARDMTLFVDDDGQAYHIYSSEHNSTLHISRLTDDYLSYSGEYIRIFKHRWMEAPAMFKRNGYYYLLMSGCSSWDPNAARGAVADNIWGPWKEISNPCQGLNPLNQLGAEKTFGAQSTFVLSIPEAGYDIAMFDIWHPKNFINSRYIWLPITYSDGSYKIIWQDFAPYIAQMHLSC